MQIRDRLALDRRELVCAAVVGQRPAASAETRENVGWAQDLRLIRLHADR